MKLPPKCFRAKTDDELVAWCEKHRAGFLLNCCPPTKKGEINNPYKLHAAWDGLDICRNLRHARDRNKLTTPYPKVYSTSAKSLCTWAKQIRDGQPPEMCGGCNPVCLPSPAGLEHSPTTRTVRNRSSLLPAYGKSSWGSLHFTVGDIVSVEWPESRYGIVDVGTWDGRIIAQDADKLTVRFEYPAYEEGGVIHNGSYETIVIDAGKGVDETYGEKAIVKRPEQGRKRRG